MQARFEEIVEIPQCSKVVFARRREPVVGATCGLHMVPIALDSSILGLTTSHNRPNTFD